MSTTDTTTHKTTIGWAIGLAAGVAIAMGLALAVNAAGHPDTAAGIVTGGMFVVVLAGVGRWRSARSADRVGTATRIAGGRADERDLRVHEGTLAIVGVFSIIFSGLASAATFLDVDAASMMQAMPFALLLAWVGGFAIVSRRT